MIRLHSFSCLLSHDDCMFFRLPMLFPFSVWRGMSHAMSEVVSLGPSNKTSRLVRIFFLIFFNNGHHLSSLILAESLMRICYERFLRFTMRMMLQICPIPLMSVITCSQR